MTVLDALPVVLLAAVVGLDVVSFPQMMFSRPLVAATLGGAVAGSVAQGLLVGVLLELLALETLPVGASRYPEWGSASVVGGALGAEFASRTAAALPMATLIGLVTALVGGGSMIQLRRLNARWAHGRAEEIAQGSSRAVIGLQLAGLTADLARGGAVAAVALVVGHPLLAVVARSWSVEARVSGAVVVAVAATVAIAALWTRATATPPPRWFQLAGRTIGAVLLWAR